MFLPPTCRDGVYQPAKGPYCVSVSRSRTLNTSCFLMEAVRSEGRSSPALLSGEAGRPLEANWLPYFYGFPPTVNCFWRRLSGRVQTSLLLPVRKCTGLRGMCSFMSNLTLMSNLPPVTFPSCHSFNFFYHVRSECLLVSHRLMLILSICSV